MEETNSIQFGDIWELVLGYLGIFGNLQRSPLRSHWEEKGCHWVVYIFRYVGITTKGLNLNYNFNVAFEVCKGETMYCLPYMQVRFYHPVNVDFMIDINNIIQNLLIASFIV